MIRAYTRTRMDPASPDSHGTVAPVEDVFVDLGTAGQPNIHQIAEGLPKAKADGFVEGFDAARKLFGNLLHRYVG